MQAALFFTPSSRLARLFSHATVLTCVTWFDVGRIHRLKAWIHRYSHPAERLLRKQHDDSTRGGHECHSRRRVYPERHIAESNHHRE
jgi:hypothetical protein